MTSLQKIQTKAAAEFDEKFSPDWWMGFGTTDGINRLGIETIKSFLSHYIQEAWEGGVQEGKQKESI